MIKVNIDLLRSRHKAYDPHKVCRTLGNTFFRDFVASLGAKIFEALACNVIGGLLMPHR